MEVTLVVNPTTLRDLDLEALRVRGEEARMVGAELCSKICSDRSGGGCDGRKRPTRETMTSMTWDRDGIDVKPLAAAVSSYGSFANDTRILRRISYELTVTFPIWA